MFRKSIYHNGMLKEIAFLCSRPTVGGDVERAGKRVELWGRGGVVLLFPGIWFRRGRTSHEGWFRHLRLLVWILHGMLPRKSLTLICGCKWSRRGYWTAEKIGVVGEIREQEKKVAVGTRGEALGETTRRMRLWEK